MNLRSLFAIIGVFVFQLFSAAPASAEGYYIAGLCTYGASCTGYYSEYHYTDISVALNSGNGGTIVCDNPGQQAYESTTGAQVFDPNGISVVLPIIWKNCRDSYYGVPQLIRGNDANGTPGVRITTTWAITRCLPGYAPSKSASNMPFMCNVNETDATATDATNEQGKPPNCDQCQKDFLRSISAGADPFGPVVGDPINAANGNEMLEEVDYSPAGGNLLSLVRTYNSGAGFGETNQGVGWSYNYRYRAIYPQDGDTVVLVRPDGGSVTFALYQGAYVGPAYEKGSLQGTFSGGRLTLLKYTRPDGDHMHKFQLHTGEPPEDVLVRFHGQAYIGAHIHPDRRKGNEGLIRLEAELGYQSGQKELTIHYPEKDTFDSVEEARDYVLKWAEVTKASNVYLR